MEETKAWLNRYGWLADYSGARDHHGISHGFGGIQEICLLLEQARQRTGLGIADVTIDWTGMCVNRHLQSLNQDPSRHMTLALSNFVDNVLAQICARFECVAWVVHQMSGQACELGPTAKLRHTNAQGCKSFGNNAYFSISICNKDEETNTCQIYASKTRRGPPTTPVVCRINGDLGEMVAATDEYTYDTVRHRIVPRAEASVFTGRPDAARQPTNEEIMSALGNQNGNWR